MKYLIYILLIIIIPSESLACSCYLSSVKDNFDNANSVFIGKVIDISQEDDLYNNVTALVEKSWKGNSDEQRSFTTAKQSSMCGVRFEVGKKYLIFSKEQIVHSCSHTMNLEWAGKIIAEIEQVR